MTRTKYRHWSLAVAIAGLVISLPAPAQSKGDDLDTICAEFKRASYGTAFLKAKRMYHAKKEKNLLVAMIYAASAYRLEGEQSVGHDGLKEIGREKKWPPVEWSVWNKRILDFCAQYSGIAGTDPLEREQIFVGTVGTLMPGPALDKVAQFQFEKLDENTPVGRFGRSSGADRFTNPAGSTAADMSRELSKDMSKETSKVDR